MATELSPESLWELVAPFIPAPRPKAKGGVPWEMLPQELGCGSGMTCWRRLRDWQQAGMATDPLRSLGLARPVRKN